MFDRLDKEEVLRNSKFFRLENSVSLNFCDFISILGCVRWAKEPKIRAVGQKQRFFEVP